MKKTFCAAWKEDRQNYRRDNTDPELVFRANYFSCYKGILVIKTPFRASCFLGVIGLSRRQQNVQTLDHEYGHALQLRNRGKRYFLSRVLFHSLTINILSRMGKLPYDYYGAPWEAEADRLGGVERKSGKAAWPEENCRYRNLLRLFFR